MIGKIFVTSSGGDPEKGRHVKLVFDTLPQLWVLDSSFSA